MKIRFTLIAVALSSALMAYYFLGSKQSIKPQSPSAQAHQFYQEPANSQATAAQRNLGFTSLTQEVVLNNLTIQGTMPSWLNGTLLRMGPGQFDLNGKSFGNFFDGFGMVHKFSFCNGTISYANKFIETKYRTKALKRGSLPNTFQEREKSSWLSAVGKLFTKAPIYDNANINVSKVGNEFVAITETPYYKAFNLATLDSKKVIFQDKLDGHLCTAHPLTDQKTGETFNILTQYGNTSNYHIYKLEPGSYSRTTICSLTTKYPSYIHSFGMTDQYIIMVVIPFVVNPMDLMFSNKAFIDNFVWKPENKTELII
ncbi:MAG: carotenoid oxygenase family protein, partial [Candidatus Babeliales bacterium]